MTYYKVTTTIEEVKVKDVTPVRVYLKNVFCRSKKESVNVYTVGYPPYHTLIIENTNSGHYHCVPLIERY